MNQNPTDTNGNQLVVGYYYKVDQVSPLTQYVGLFGQSLRFKILNSDPEFFILRYLVDYSPKITFPKSISLFSIEIKAFLQVHTRGISIRPVSDRIGNVEFMS